MESNTTNKTLLSILALATGIVAVVIAVLMPLIARFSFTIYALYIISIVSVVLGLVACFVEHKRAFSITGAALGAIALLVAILISANVIKVAKTPNNGRTTAIDSKTLADASGANTKQILAQELTVELGKFDVINNAKQQSMTEFGIPIKVKNRTNKSANYIIKVEAVTAKGDHIAYSSFFIENFAPQEERTGYVFRSINPARIKAFQAATFRVVQVKKTPIASHLAPSSKGTAVQKPATNQPNNQHDTSTKRAKKPRVRRH